MDRFSRGGSRAVPAVLFFLLLLAAGVSSAPARGATLYEQLDASLLGEAEIHHDPGEVDMPVQTLGIGLSGPISSVAYKLHGTDVANDVAIGWGQVILFACPNDTYLRCLPTYGTSQQVISQIGDDAIVRADFSGAGSFNPGVYYYLYWVTGHDLALYGTATDQYANGKAQWIDGEHFQTDANGIVDWAFRICDTTDCDLPPATPPDTTAPSISITTTASSSTLPTISGTSDDTALVNFALGGKYYSATPGGGIWSAALPAGNELAEGDYAIEASSTDAAGNTGTATQAFFVDLTAPSITITGGPEEGSTVSASSGTFSFTISEAHLATAACAWDGGVFVPCTDSSSATFTDGAHTFTVAATDAVGHTTSLTRTFSTDTTAPALAETAPIAESTDTTPGYSFTSTEAGTLAVGGSCSSSAATASAGSNSISFGELSPGTYSDCTVTVTDAAGNASLPLAVTAFTIDKKTPPPAAGGGGSGGGGGVLEGPLSVGYQVPLPAPLVPAAALNATAGLAAGASIALPETSAAPEHVTPKSTPPAAAPAKSANSKAQPPAASAKNQTVSVARDPWESSAPYTPSVELSAAAVQTGFTLPWWAWVLAGAALFLLVITALYRLVDRR